MNKQQKMWSGEFGNEYHKRNTTDDRSEFWREVMNSHGTNIYSVLELGAGKGDNLRALRYLFSMRYCRMTGLDINKGACDEMEKHGIVAINQPFPGKPIDNRYDMVMTRGFLIHVPTADVDAVLEKMYELSNRYICIAEYYSTERRQIKYRGNKDALWTDDFAGRLMDKHPDLELLRYGFKYGREGGDDITYFLLEKGEKR